MVDVSQCRHLSQPHRPRNSHETAMAKSQASSQAPNNYNTLPTELRLMIISKTFSPRTVVLEFGGTDSPRLFCRTPNPITLYLNRESRAETLRYYKQIYASYTKTTVYFNPHVDSLLVRKFSLPFTTSLTPPTGQPSNRKQRLPLQHLARINPTGSLLAF